jgi:ABC-type transport system involved in multi-copper enzyme maturation permease subunit
MPTFITTTLKGIFRDRVFHGILMVALLLPLVPAVSQLSMRQVTELSITLSLSLISFIMLLLAVFLGGTVLWRDIERRYTYSVLSLPCTRSSYLLGRFAGTALFLLLAELVLGCIAMAVVWIVAAGTPPDRPVVWLNFGCAVLFDAIKYNLLVAIALLFATVSSSFFLPVFGTISAFLVGSSTQQVYDYVHSPQAKSLPLFIRSCASMLYYLLPNFSAFDLKVNAIYGLPLTPGGLLLTFCYALIYGSVVLTLAAMIFTRREMK